MPNPNARRLPVSDLRWNAAAQRYTTPAGKFKATSAVFDAINTDIENRGARMVKHGEALKDAAAQFKAGAMDQDGYTAAVKGWRDKMAAEIKADHLCQGAVASGGFRNMGPAQHGAVGGALRVQYAYLNNFAIEAAGNPDIVLSLDKSKRPFDSRVASYAEEGRATFSALEDMNNRDNGFQSVQSFLEEGAHHCDGPQGCPVQAELGRVNLDDPRRIRRGRRKCRGKCKCPQKYFKEPAPSVA